MLYPVSDAIATDHPELADQVAKIDGYLAQIGRRPFRLELATDLLDMDKGQLVRLLGLYEQGGAVEQVDMLLCPQDGEVVEKSREGALWFCDVCEREYGAEECERVMAFRLRPGLAPSGTPAEGEFGAPPPPEAVRDLLLAAYTAAEFEDLFRYTQRLDLRPVLNEFSPHDGLAAMVRKAIDYCQHHDLLWLLLDEVKVARPNQYDRFKDELRGL